MRAWRIPSAGSRRGIFATCRGPALAAITRHSACGSQSRDQRSRVARACHLFDKVRWLPRRSRKAHRTPFSRLRHDNRQGSARAHFRRNTGLPRTTRQSSRIWRSLSFLQLLQNQAHHGIRPGCRYCMTRVGDCTCCTVELQCSPVYGQKIYESQYRRPR